VIGTNLNYSPVVVEVATLGLSVGGIGTSLLSYGAKAGRPNGKTQLTFDAVGTGAWKFRV
jgi:hypothetical protein